MTSNGFRRWRIFYVLNLALLLIACGGGGGSGGDGDGDDNGPKNPTPMTFNCEGSGTVTVAGTAEYEFVPAVDTATGAKLDYAASEFRPIRMAEVQAVCPDGSSTYATTVTNNAGEYELTVPENVDVAIRVRALMDADGSPSWDVKVVDNTSNQAVWSAQGEAFESGTGNVNVDMQAASGWGGSSYSSTRAAAPFAILDSVYMAMLKVLAAEPDANFPPLKLNWHPDNRDCDSDSDNYPYPDGCIGTSFFADYGNPRGHNIFILGDVDEDTDEYDNHVIIHEWGHYYENTFARSDSIGGAHSSGNVLDPRVAFGEGWGNAFSGIATGDPLYVDTRGTGQGSGFWIDVESDVEGKHPGWWNEVSVQEIIYDLYDDTPGEDAAALGFDAIHTVLTNGQKTTDAVTTLFPFIHYLRENHTAQQPDIDAVVAEHDIATIDNVWGDDRAAGGLLSGNGDDGSEFGNTAEEYIVPVHTNLGPLGAGTHSICTSSNAADSHSTYNRLGVRRFLRFTAPTPGSWNIHVAGEPGSDPDFYVILRGETVAFGENTGTTETESVPLSGGLTYVMEVLDYSIANGDTTGESCLNITFEQN